jgi:arabinan endo-1,5-alpha-L-arabinosidase
MKQLQHHLLTALLVLGAAEGFAADKTRVTYSEVAVHDPSIVVDGSNYYIFGSHLATAKSTDMLNWSYFGGGETDACTLFANAAGNKVGYADAYNSNAVTTVKNYRGTTVAFGTYNAHSWQYKGNTVQGMQWAPDVIYNPTMGKWLMYMSVNGDNWCSSIVCLAADNIEGPYIFQGPVVFSGFRGSYAHNGYTATDDWKYTDLAIATGATSLPARYAPSDSWGNYWPNCIDPCVFYDENGKLRMAYGSWSGGIWEIELDENTGLRDYMVTYPYQVSGTTVSAGAANKNTTSDPYFGKKIAGGYYVSGEGSYIRHIGDYYYLFMSYGGLNPNAGYDMRIFRSKNPDGPFVDGEGVSAIYSVFQMNYGQTAVTDRGMRLMGAYAGWGAMNKGERAQGHNSVYVDGDGNAFVVYHTKFDDGTYGHEVRVHQLFVNSEGWLVAAPFRYTGLQTTSQQVANSQLFAASDLAGTYKLLQHPYRQPISSSGDADATFSKANEEKPVTVTLTADGKISGDMTGTWSFTKTGASYLSLSFDDLDGLPYEGVVFAQKMDYYKDVPATCISAVSSLAGMPPVWLYKEGAVSTGISQVLTSPAATSKQAYNINGQAVGDDYKGIVIIGGKKVVRK